MDVERDHGPRERRPAWLSESGGGGDRARGRGRLWTPVLEDGARKSFPADPTKEPGFQEAIEAKMSHANLFKVWCLPLHYRLQASPMESKVGMVAAAVVSGVCCPLPLLCASFLGLPLLSFSPEQVLCVGEVVLQLSDPGQLGHFLCSLLAHEVWRLEIAVGWWVRAWWRAGPSAHHTPAAVTTYARAQPIFYYK